MSRTLEQKVNKKIQDTCKSLDGMKLNTRPPTPGLTSLEWTFQQRGGDPSPGTRS